MGGEIHIKQPSQNISVGEHSANTSRKHVIIAIKQLRARVWRCVCVCVGGGGGTTHKHTYQCQNRGVDYNPQPCISTRHAGATTTFKQTYVGGWKYNP